MLRDDVNLLTPLDPSRIIRDPAENIRELAHPEELLEHESGSIDNFCHLAFGNVLALVKIPEESHQGEGFHHGRSPDPGIERCVARFPVKFEHETAEPFLPDHRMECGGGFGNHASRIEDCAARSRGRYPVSPPSPRHHKTEVCSRRALYERVRAHGCGHIRPHIASPGHILPSLRHLIRVERHPLEAGTVDVAQRRSWLSDPTDTSVGSPPGLTKVR